MSPRARWFQLSLKSLFLLMLLVATFFAGYSLALRRAGVDRREAAQVIGRQGDRPVKFAEGLATFYEGLVLAVLGTCSADADATKDQWEQALKADHLRIQFAKPRVFAVSVERGQVEADEIVVTISAADLPDAIIVRSGESYHSFGKYDPKACFFIQEQLKSLFPPR
jgi:hypothetical protein